MNPEIVIAIILAVIAVVGVIITGSTLIVSLRRNGRHQKARDEAIAKDQHDRDIRLEQGYLNIKSQLNHPNHGLPALDNKITNIKTEYGIALARHDERLTSLEN